MQVVLAALLVGEDQRVATQYSHPLLHLAGGLVVHSQTKRVAMVGLAAAGMPRLLLAQEHRGKDMTALWVVVLALATVAVVGEEQVLLGRLA